mgnify:CR=1 FL=1
MLLIIYEIDHERTDSDWYYRMRNPLNDYENNVIKKHENTRAEKELDRIRHVDICDAQTGPIFLAYRDNAAITAIVNKIKTQDVEYDFTSPDGIRHRVWVNRGSRGYCGNPKGICGY